MSFTVAEVVTFVCSYLEGKLDLENTNPHNITGGVYPFQRPKDSKSEDVVVNGLALGREAVQKGVVNVNVYVPNQPFTKPGTAETDLSRPDMDRIQLLGQVLNGYLAEHWNEEGDMALEVNQDLVVPDINDQHYINFRVEFRALNI